MSKSDSLAWKSPSDDWRDRLHDTLIRHGYSRREVSLRSNLGAGYLHSILDRGKDPSITNLIAICRELGVSLSWVLYGVQITDETERILSLLEAHPKRRAGILQILTDGVEP